MKKIITVVHSDSTICTNIHNVIREEFDVVVIDIKTTSKTGKTDIVNSYSHRLKAYMEEQKAIIEELKVENPNKKPLREGSKFIPLKKRR